MRGHQHIIVVKAGSQYVKLIIDENILIQKKICFAPHSLKVIQNNIASQQC